MVTFRSESNTELNLSLFGFYGVTSFLNELISSQLLLPINWSSYSFVCISSSSGKLSLMTNERNTKKLPQMKNVCAQPRSEQRADPITGPTMSPSPVSASTHPTICSFFSGKSLVAMEQQVVQTKAEDAPCMNLNVKPKVKMYAMLSSWGMNPKNTKARPIVQIPSEIMLVLPHD